MKIILDVDNRRFEFERDPLPPERFAVVCKLVGAAIGGAVLLVAIHLVGKWAIGGAVGALALVGLYKLLKASF